MEKHSAVGSGNYAEPVMLRQSSAGVAPKNSLLKPTGRISLESQYSSHTAPAEVFGIHDHRRSSAPAVSITPPAVVTLSPFVNPFDVLQDQIHSNLMPSPQSKSFSGNSFKLQSIPSVSPVIMSHQSVSSHVFETGTKISPPLINPFEFLEKTHLISPTRGHIRAHTSFPESNHVNHTSNASNPFESLEHASRGRSGTEDITPKFSLINLREMAAKMEDEAHKLVIQIMNSESSEQAERDGVFKRIQSIRLTLDNLIKSHEIAVNELKVEKVALEQKLAVAEHTKKELELAHWKEIQSLKDAIVIMQNKFSITSQHREVSLLPKTKEERVKTVLAIHTFMKQLDRDTYQMLVAQLNGLSPSLDS